MGDGNRDSEAGAAGAPASDLSPQSQWCIKRWRCATGEAATLDHGGGLRALVPSDLIRNFSSTSSLDHMWEGRIYIGGVRPLLGQPGGTQRTGWRLSKRGSNTREGFHGPIPKAQSTSHPGSRVESMAALMAWGWGRVGWHLHGAGGRSGSAKFDGQRWGEDGPSTPRQRAVKSQRGCSRPGFPCSQAHAHCRDWPSQTKGRCAGAMEGRRL
jgi:hypothetical protein